MYAEARAMMWIESRGGRPGRLDPKCLNPACMYVKQSKYKAVLGFT